MAFLNQSGMMHLFGPTTLAGAASPNLATSAALPCLGARGVIFYTNAEATVAPSAAAYEYSCDGGVTWYAADATYFITQSGLTGANLQGGGKALIVHPRVADGMTRILASHMRLKITGNVTPGQDITNLTIEGVAYYDASNVGPWF